MEGMLYKNGHKLKKHGITCIFAGIEKDEDNKLIVIIATRLRSHYICALILGKYEVLSVDSFLNYHPHFR